MSTIALLAAGEAGTIIVCSAVDMNIEQAIQALETQKRQFQSKIPAGASAMRTRYLAEMVDEEVEAARKHLQAVYESHLEVGPDFTALAEHANHPKYAFWLAGIQRHLRECETILTQQPDATGRRSRRPTPTLEKER